jgi:uncharacterized membrane protein YgdD (TMEM256/DUF423 family)
MNWTRLAASLLGLAVILGAFGVHGLKGHLDAYSMGVYEKAVFYHFVHALGMLIASLLPQMGLISSKDGMQVCSLLAAGILLFAGSLYLLAVTGVTLLGAITPFGGLAFIAAWLLLAWRLPAGW